MSWWKMKKTRKKRKQKKKGTSRRRSKRREKIKVGASFCSIDGRVYMKTMRNMKKEQEQ